MTTTWDYFPTILNQIHFRRINPSKVAHTCRYPTIGLLTCQITRNMLFISNSKTWAIPQHKSMVFCQNVPTSHAYAWQIGPFWQDTLEIWQAHHMDTPMIIYNHKKASHLKAACILYGIYSAFQLVHIENKTKCWDTSSTALIPLSGNDATA